MNVLPMSENTSNELGYVLPHYSPVFKMWKDCNSRVYVGTEVLQGIVLSPVAIFASLLKISISGWADFALMTPEQLLSGCCDCLIQGWKDRLQKRERESLQGVYRGV